MGGQRRHSSDNATHAAPDIPLDRAANDKFDVLWVMGQMGHEDSKMTMDVYAQLQQRVKRE